MTEISQGNVPTGLPHEKAVLLRRIVAPGQFDLLIDNLDEAVPDSRRELTGVSENGKEISYVIEPRRNRLPGKFRRKAAWMAYKAIEGAEAISHGKDNQDGYYYAHESPLHRLASDMLLTRMDGLSELGRAERGRQSGRSVEISFTVYAYADAPSVGMRNLPPWISEPSQFELWFPHVAEAMKSYRQDNHLEDLQEKTKRILPAGMPFGVLFGYRPV
jgi:hypothetical protein